MLTVNDVNNIETDNDCSQLDYYKSIQKAINDGCWSLQGSYGRAMMAAIDNGYCMLGTSRAKDYWGNVIPARTDVQEGTKGSREFVVEKMGEEWAAAMEGV
jgi:hypothetical protein